jgi:hypothetical protein
MAKEEKTKRNDNASLAGKAILYTLGLVALALIIILVSSLFVPNVVRVRGLPPDAGPAPPGPEPEGVLDKVIDTGFALRIALSVVNILVILYLLYVHMKDYLTLHSKFTLGLVIFLFSFLLYALSSLPILHVFFGHFGMAGVFSFIPMLFSAIGLLVFAKLSNE